MEASQDHVQCQHLRAGHSVLADRSWVVSWKQWLTACSLAVERTSCLHRYALQSIAAPQHPSALLACWRRCGSADAAGCLQLVDAASLQTDSSLAAAHSACYRSSGRLVWQACCLQCTAAASCMRLPYDQHQVFAPKQTAAARGCCMHCATAASCLTLCCDYISAQTHTHVLAKVQKPLAWNIFVRQACWLPCAADVSGRCMPPRPRVAMFPASIQS